MQHAVLTTTTAAAALALLASGATALPQTFESQGTFAPRPSISPIATLTNSIDACVEFGSCSTAPPDVKTLTYPPGIVSLSDKPAPVAPTDSAAASSYQASLAAAGASSVFSSLASSSSSTAATTTATSNSTGAAMPQLSAKGASPLAAVAGAFVFGAALLIA